MILTQNLGFPRIGVNRELKKACESYWAGKSTYQELQQTGKELRIRHWTYQQKAGIDIIPSNDFSFYDHVLDMSLLLGVIPARYGPLLKDKSKEGLARLYFAMARGYQADGIDVPAMEMTKWFDTNYHYIVPEFHRQTEFSFYSTKVTDEYLEAKEAGIETKPVLVGPVSYLLLGKEKEKGMKSLDLLDKLIPVYVEILNKLHALGAKLVQLDEPFLATEVDDQTKKAFKKAYARLASDTKIDIQVATYFGSVADNLDVLSTMPVKSLHVDLVTAPEQFDAVLDIVPEGQILSLGIVNGRNIWKTDLNAVAGFVDRAVSKLGIEKVWVAPSCSLLHVPIDLDAEDNDSPLPKSVKSWMAFAKQKLQEIVLLKRLTAPNPTDEDLRLLKFNRAAIEDRLNCPQIKVKEVREKVEKVKNIPVRRKSPYEQRNVKQQDVLKLPLFPSTTIGSFPQTKEVRALRAQYKKKLIDKAHYEEKIKQAIEDAIRVQEEIGLDVLVHGEFERNDMVEYFGELLQGFVFTNKGWVQSYGSRCVKPPVIFGDVYRPNPITVEWTKFAQSLTSKPVKGMLTGPVTILQWSFVRDDQARSETAFQIALAISEEVKDLEKAGIKIIQVDEPALREGLPVSKKKWKDYLVWAVKAFRISTSVVNDETQIHTHMCYCDFNDIIEDISDLDADVISLETSRSQVELLNAFYKFKYPNQIGPGVYDIHSPRVPSKDEMVDLLSKTVALLPAERLWVNPDCGLKTRHWEETKAALAEMVKAAKEMREKFLVKK